MLNRVTDVVWLTAAEQASPAQRTAALLFAEQHTEGSCNHRDWLALYEVARRCRGHVVEIGTWKGKSACALARGLLAREPAEPAARVLAFDLWRGGAADWPGTDAAQEAYAWWVLHGVAHVIVAVRGAPPGDLPQRWPAADLVRPAGRERTAVGLVFVDGAHEHAAALADLSLAAGWGPQAIAVHDFQAVREAVREALPAEAWDCTLRSDSLAVFEPRGGGGLL